MNRVKGVDEPKPPAEGNTDVIRNSGNYRIESRHDQIVNDGRAQNRPTTPSEE